MRWKWLQVLKLLEKCKNRRWQDTPAILNYGWRPFMFTSLIGEAAFKFIFAYKLLILYCTQTASTPHWPTARRIDNRCIHALCNMLLFQTYKTLTLFLIMLLCALCNIKRKSRDLKALNGHTLIDAMWCMQFIYWHFFFKSHNAFQWVKMEKRFRSGASDIFSNKPFLYEFHTRWPARTVVRNSCKIVLDDIVSQQSVFLDLDLLQYGIWKYIHKWCCLSHLTQFIMYFLDFFHNALKSVWLFDRTYY